jgi:hypothetical protein
MASGTLLPWPLNQPLDDDGLVIPGALLYVYVAGTSTPVVVYADVGLTIPLSNPVEAAASGRFPELFMTPGSSVKVVLKTADNVEIWSADNILASPSVTGGVDLVGVAGEALPALSAVYLSDGSGGKTAGSWYLADASQLYSSVSPEVGVTQSAIALGATGTIRTRGEVSGFTTIVPGGVYYIGTAGAATLTAPANARAIYIGLSPTTVSVAAVPVPAALSTRCEGRLTLTTAVPVTTADVLAATTIFWTPFRGNHCAVYNGTTWIERTFTELSIVVPATTATLYDVFVFDNSGTLALELTAWTNDTTRATALVLQDGVLVKTGALTRRYLGTFRTTGVSGQTEDSIAKRYLWNYYNRTRRHLRRYETTASWTYGAGNSVNGTRQANANVANQVEVVVGVAESLVEISVMAWASNTVVSAMSTYASIAIGIDSTTVGDVTFSSGVNTAYAYVATVPSPMVVTARLMPTVGRHFFAWLEYVVINNGGTNTMYRTDPFNNNWQGGMIGSIDG